jgi:hypothetical protein
MEKSQTIIFAAAMAFLLVRLYQKYVKKDKGKDKSATGTNKSSGTGFPSSSKDDDYEPYAKK